MYPVNIKNPNPALAKIIISQYGGLLSDWYKNVSTVTDKPVSGKKRIIISFSEF